MKRKIYLASRWSHREELKPIAKRITQMGHEVTSTWLEGDVMDSRGTPMAPINAARDLHDIGHSTTLVLWPNDHGKPSSQGKMVEFGYALGLGLEIFVVEPHTTACIFTTLPSLRHCPSWNALFTALGNLNVE